MTEGRAGIRLKVLAGLVAFLFAALATRLWFLQVLATERYRDEAQNNAVRLVDTPAQRGRILDANGNVLVDNRMSLQVLVDRQQLGGREEEVLFKLSQLLDVKAQLLGERLHDDRYYVFTPVPVAVDVSKRVAFYIAEHKTQFPGVSVLEAPVRTYPDGKLAAHVLGYLGAISPEKLDAPAFSGYDQTDVVGQSGVEAFYEHDLRGTKGIVKYLVNAEGKNLREIGSQRPKPGNDLVLALDATIQQMAEDALANGMQQARGIFDEFSGKYLRANAGAVVVMEPGTGRIRALVSLPAYRPAVFLRGFTQREFNRLRDPAANNPLFDRTTQGEYAPGSTYKPFIALSAMRTTAYGGPGSGDPGKSIASPGGYYNCPAQYTAPGDESGTVFENWSSVGRGFISLSTALEISCDTVFYAFGWEYWLKYFHSVGEVEAVAQAVASGEADEIRPLQPLQRDLRALGLGRPTNIDLPNEHAGRVPTALWKATIHQENPKAFPEPFWLPGDFINMAVGQGDTLVTPLQMATAYSAIANGGHVCAPRIGLQIQRPDGSLLRRIKPRCREKLPFSENQLAFVRQALATVPISGTAAGAFRGFPFSDVSVAGKTGTAQREPFQDTSWFVAMAPAEDPQYVVVAMVEQGGHGSTTAAPIVRNIIEGLFGLPQSGFVSGEATD